MENETEAEKGTKVEVNGPFNKVIIVQHSDGTNLLDNTLGVILLGFISIFLLFELARVYDHNRKLMNKCCEK